jgi:UrcA family protein
VVLTPALHSRRPAAHRDRFESEDVMKMIILAGIGLALAGTSAAAAPVVIEGQRAPTQEFLTEQVSFADLDISSNAGLSALKGRIGAAATRVCGSTNPEPLMANIESLGCYRHAMSDSLAQVSRILAARGSGAAVAAASVTVSAH